MKMHMGYASVSVAGDYYQVMFEETAPDEKQDSMGSKYLLIQRQFESQDRGLIYVESHDENYIGHFNVARARLDPKCLFLVLDRKNSAVIEITFETSAHNYAEVERVMRIMIPNIAVYNEERHANKRLHRIADKPGSR
jgi:hypothetical protein